MFKFLKEKLKSSISKISEKIRGKEEKPVEPELKEKPLEIKKEEPKKEAPKHKLEIKPKAEIKKAEELKKIEQIEKEIEEKPVEIREEKSFFAKVKEKFTKKEEIKEEKETTGKKAEAPAEEKKDFFGIIKEKITTTKINEKEFNEFFEDLEISLMESNVAVEVIDKIKEDLKNSLVDKPIKRGNVEQEIKTTLMKSIEELFIEPFDLLSKIKQKKPFIMCFFGINGSGKTTTIAKVANMLKEKKYSVVLAASDTFRAASIEQLQKHADNLGIKMIRHDYGSDPAAVAFDAVKHANAKNIDVVLIDTAGRMHSNANLIDEMKKIVGVAKPDLRIFVGESITGNDCIEQAKTFNDEIGIDAIILSKADIDEKGGAAISVSYVTKKPIIYLGMGQNYGDLQSFDSELIIKNLGLEA